MMERLDAFMLGILVALTPSLVAIALLVWRADAPKVQENRAARNSDRPAKSTADFKKQWLAR